MTRLHPRWMMLLGLALLVTVACSDDDDPAGPKDEIGPAAVLDLTADFASDSSVVLTWTAPGDDDTTGTATRYELRYRTESLSMEDWESAIPITSVPVPGAAGTQQTLVASGFSTDTTYAFAIRTADEESNWSALSNVPQTTWHGLPLTSIANVLANLERSYQEKNYEEYSKLFDVAYEYVFAPQDVGGPDNIPMSWGRADELGSADNMLGSVQNMDGYRAEQITLSFTSGPDTSTDLNPNWRKVVLSEVDLRIIGRHDTTAEPLIYEVRGDKAEFYFIQTDETAPGTTDKIWKIVRWDDKPIMVHSAVASQTTTWGQIKSIWR